MSDEYKKIQIMFEEIKGDIKAIAEGHSVLLNGIDRVDNKLEEFRAEVNQNFDALSKDLKGHIRQIVPPAHAYK
ncbi:MAG: hypothetical protein WCV91_04855 [Candidatus Margulisiibacteriota bacterium]|jgi:hypothetical protein